MFGMFKNKSWTLLLPRHYTGVLNDEVSSPDFPDDFISNKVNNAIMPGSVQTLVYFTAIGDVCNGFHMPLTCWQYLNEALWYMNDQQMKEG